MDNNLNVPPYMPYAAQTSSLAVVSLVFGILGFTFLPFIGSIVALFTGYAARKEIRQSAGRLTGDGMALAGLIMGWIVIGLSTASVCIIAVLALLGPAIGNIFSNVVISI